MYLADQYKAPPAIAPSPSVAGFKEWLKRQPRDGTFNYFCTHGCALDQYLSTIGTSWAQLNESDRDLLITLDDFPNNAGMTVKPRLPTFGDVLAEIEKAGL